MMIRTVTLPRSDLAAVCLLALAETSLVMVQRGTIPTTRRGQRIKAALENIEQIDATYRGKFPETWQAQAEACFSDIEARINRLFEDIGNV